MSSSVSKSLIRIVVVDDHPVVRLGIQTVLSMTPDLSICGEADNADAAVRVIESAKPDLAIVDLSLGSVSGLELIRDLYKIDSALRVLVLSMHDETLFARRALMAGARGYITKTEIVESLVHAIREVLAGRIYTSPRVSQQLLERVTRVGSATEQHWLETLTDRELEVFELIGRGHSTAEIASRLHVSVKTVETHRSNIKAKLQVEDATALIRLAVSWTEHL